MSQWTTKVAQSYAKLGEQSHVAILHDFLLPLMQPVQGRTMLDFGCGDGHLGVRLAAEGVARLTCIDQSEDLLRTAQQNAREAGIIDRCMFELGDEDALPTPQRYHLVVCSLMLMMCENRQRLERSITGLIGSCAPGGRVLIVLTHPCFRGAVHATYHNHLPDDFEYWHSGRPYKVVLDPDVNQVPTSFHDYHWTLTDYASAIHESGGAIDQMIEVPGQYDVSGQPIGDPAYLILSVRAG